MARLIVDTGPLVAAISRRDRQHRLAARLLTSAGRDALVPDPVIVEVDLLTRRRYGPPSARAFLAAMHDGAHVRDAPTVAEWETAVAIDARHADLDLGLVDATVMAMAHNRDLPILTFDFRDFQAVPGPSGEPHRLIVQPHELA